MAFDAPLPYGGKDVEGLAAHGTLRIYLFQGEAIARGETLEDQSEPGKEVDSMSTIDFLTNAGRFLERTGVKSVYDLWFDRRMVYRVSKGHEREDNHGEALAKAINLSKSGGSPKEVEIWSHGTSGDFYLEFRLKFRRVHDAGAQSLVLEVGGNPRELTDPTGENEFELDDRLRRLESDKAGIEKENEQIKYRFESRLQELQGILKQMFKVKSITQDTSVDVASIW